jgi:hypothetical protein
MYIIRSKYEKKDFGLDLTVVLKHTNTAFNVKKLTCLTLDGAHCRAFATRTMKLGASAEAWKFLTV